MERRLKDFNGAHVTAAFDVFTDAEGVVEHEENPAEDILDQGLRTEAYRNAEDAGPCDQRGYLDPEPRQHGQHGNHRDEDGEGVAEYR